MRAGRAGMSAPKRNATSGPPTFQPTRSISWWSCSSPECCKPGALTRPDEGISEPLVLRRADGSSVYTVAGSELFTSTRILAAEQRLVAAAGRTDGRVVDAATVELAILESAANGNALDDGQTALIRSMCTSGARMQLAIAPAGAGKTTVMSTLVQAWSDSGGQVVG